MKLNNHPLLQYAPFLNDTTSTADLELCGTEGCLYKVCSRIQCHHFENNANYCNNCFIANNGIDKDNTERAFE